MDLNILKEQLSAESFEALQGYVTELQNQKAEARNESISGRKSLKEEVAKLKAIKETLFDKLGLDDEADLSTVSIPTKGAELEVSKKYENQIKKLQQELVSSKDTYTALEGKHKSTLLQATLVKALAGKDFIDTDLVSDYIKSRVVFENDEFLYKDGDKVLALDEGVKLLAAQKPHLVRSQGNAGSGFQNTGSVVATKSFNEMTLTEKTALYNASPEQYEAAKSAAQVAA